MQNDVTAYTLTLSVGWSCTSAARKYWRLL